MSKPLSIARVRELKPEWRDFSDDEVVQLVQRSYLPDASLEDVAGRLGHKLAPPPAPPAPTATWGDRIADTGLSLLSGAVDVAAFPVGLADIPTGGRVGKFLEETVGFRPDDAKQILADQYSDAYKASQREVQQAEGIVPTLAAAARNPSVVAQTVAQSLPSMGAGGVLGRGLVAAAPKLATMAGGVIPAAAGEGIVAAGSAAEDIRGETKDGLLAPGQATLAGMSGVLTSALGAAGGKIAQRLGIGDVDMALAGAARNPAAQTSLVRRVLGGAVSEGLLEELPQSVQEQVLKNLALDQPLDKDVDQAAVLGVLSGGVMGGGFNAMSSAPDAPPTDPTVPPAGQSVPPTDPTVPPAGPAQRAVEVAAATGATPAPPPAPVTDEGIKSGLLEVANQRARILDEKAKGTPDQTVPGPDDKPITVSGKLPQFLTPEEKAERDFLQKHGGDVNALAQAYPSVVDALGKLGAATLPAPPAPASPAVPPAGLTPEQEVQAMGRLEAQARTDEALTRGPREVLTPMHATVPEKPAVEDDVESAAADDVVGPHGAWHTQATAEKALATKAFKDKGLRVAKVRHDGDIRFVLKKTALQAAADRAAESPNNDLSPPTDRQKEAGNYQMGHHRLKSGFDISIETPRGGTRKSKEDAPEQWVVPSMPAHYGYVKGIKGADGDHLDLFIGPEEDNGRFWVINQKNPDGTFDEHKLVTGVSSPEQAVQIYKDSFADKFGDKVFLSISDEKTADQIRDDADHFALPSAYGVPVSAAPASAAPTQPGASNGDQQEEGKGRGRQEEVLTSPPAPAPAPAAVGPASPAPSEAPNAEPPKTPPPPADTPPAGPKLDAAPPAGPASASLRQRFYEGLKAGNLPNDNRALRKMVEDADGKPAEPSRLKEAQEDLEAALAQHARDIVAEGTDPRATFDRLVELYGSQPLLNIRTSTSVANQAYSTPSPLAFLANQMVGATPESTMWEPTGGTGMLALVPRPARVSINEWNPKRAQLLREQGFSPSQEDATRPIPGPQVDVVAANPPFGSAPVPQKVDGYGLKQLDHIIAAHALARMKDDGKGVLILGASKVEGGKSDRDRIFLNWLYSHYNVTNHFEVDGKLYGRQGASWPVRVLLVEGRKASNLRGPAEGVIRRLNNWSDVYEAGQERGTAGAVEGRDAGEPGGSPVGNGDVAGSSPAPVVDQPAVPPGGMAPPGGGQRTGTGEAAAGPAATSEGRRDPRPAGTTGLKKPAEKVGQFQVTYEPHSRKKDEAVLVPANMAGPLDQALSRLEDEVGDLDEFVRAELDYPSVEAMLEGLMGLQIDSVASAIHQFKRGKAVIIADQTGIGKGRQAAAVLRWAQKHGKVPMFLTVKPDLFTDMHEELAAIGSPEFAPLIVNANEGVVVDKKTNKKAFTMTPSQRKRVFEQIIETGRLPEGSTGIFATYSQVQLDGSMQRQVLMALAPSAIVVLDESHNAAGDSNTGEFMRGMLALAQGVTYLSATYAKRPDNMPVYSRTDIGSALGDADALINAMSAGGLPLQTLVAAKLVEAGQMFRRERSFEGITFAVKTDLPNTEWHRRVADQVTSGLRAIVAADRAFHNGYMQRLKDDLEEAGEGARDAGNMATESADHTAFTSIVHNAVRQMLLALKAQSVADDAIASLRAGKKPILALEQTFESFLSAYVEDAHIPQGGSLKDLDYRSLLTRALTRTRFYIHKKADGSKERVFVPLNALDPETLKLYQEAQATIDALKVEGLPVSPVDWIRHTITQAGYSIAEITGRQLVIDYSDPANPVLGQRDKDEQENRTGIKDRFNNGGLDVVLLNVAGSTGISLHASERFKDQRVRQMIIVQAAQDINIFMQMLGRNNRTGQVVKPEYQLLQANLPAERRPNAILAGKMKGLNANTSGDTESNTSVNSPDYLNKYGDQVVAEWLVENPEMAGSLDLLDEAANGEEGLARKATGRLALMPWKVQEESLDEIEARYNALIAYLDETGQNDLVPRTLDFQAREVRTAVISEGKDPTTPFGQDAVYVEFSVKAQGKPMTLEEARNAAKAVLDGKTPAAFAFEMRHRLKEAWTEWHNRLNPDLTDMVSASNQAAQDGMELIDRYRIGSQHSLKVNEEPLIGVVINLRNAHKNSGNPFSQSKFAVTFAINSAMRTITVPGSQLKKVVEGITRVDLEDAFRPRPDEREIAKVVTGNVLAAYGELVGADGRIVQFTREDGTIEQGLLLPKAFNPAKNIRHDVVLDTPEKLLQYLRESRHPDTEKLGVYSRDTSVRVERNGGGIKIRVPRSKAKGAAYFLDPRLLEHTGDFVTEGSSMVAKVPASQAEDALGVLLRKVAIYVPESRAEDARTVLGLPAPAQTSTTGRNVFAEGWTTVDNVDSPMTAESLTGEVEALFGKSSVVQVVATPADLTDERARNALEQNPQAQALTMDRSRVVLVASRIGAHEARGIVMHEVGVHMGVEDKDTRQLVRQIERWAEKGSARERILARAALERAAKSSSTRTDQEPLAYFVQFAVDAGVDPLAPTMAQSLFARLVRNLRMALRRMGLNVKITPEDVVAYAYGLAKKQLRPRAGVQMSEAAGGGQTQTEAFRRWFGDSKVVDDAGRPLVVYHGTASDIMAFEATKSRDVGFHFGGIDAANYVIGRESQLGRTSGNVMPVYLSIRNPLRVPDMNFAPFSFARALADRVDRGEVSGLDALELRNLADSFERGRQGAAADAMARTVTYLLDKGFDGLVYSNRKEKGGDSYVAFRPEQIKSAIGNRGTFDPASPDIRFAERGPAPLWSAATSRLNDARDLRLPMGYRLGDLMAGGSARREGGRLHWWHSTVGTPFNLAHRNPAFRAVYDGIQRLLDDVSLYAQEAARLAPTILPRLDGWSDLLPAGVAKSIGRQAKEPISAADSQALAKAVFGGTLSWGRDSQGRLVSIDDLRRQAEGLDVHQKAQELLRRRLVRPDVLRMWQGRRMEEYEAIIEGKFDREVTRPGVVFTRQELRETLGLTDRQADLYVEARAAIDRSLDDMAIAQMVRQAQEFLSPEQTQEVLDSHSLTLASEQVQAVLQAAAALNADRSDTLLGRAEKIADLRAKIAQLKAEGYAPLSRFGRLALDVVDRDGNRVFFSLYETERERRKALREMQSRFSAAEGFTITQGTISEEKYKIFQQLSPDTAQLFGEILGLDTTGDSAADVAFQEFLKRARANTSAMKRLIHRKGIDGFSLDVGRTLAAFIYSNARLSANTLNMGAIDRAIEAIPLGEGELADQAIKLRDYAVNPQEEAQAWRGLLFAQYLGGSVASALVNSMQPFMVSMPFLSQYGGLQKAGRAMANALNMVRGKTAPDEDLKAALLRAEEDGTVSPQEVHQLMAQAQGRATLQSGDGTRAGNALASAANARTKLALAWGKVFGVAEQFNRRITFIAAYQLARDQGAGDPAAFAKRAVQETQFVYNKGNKPRWARGVAGSLAFTFKQYSISYLELLERTWNTGAPGSPQREAARRAVGFMLLALFLGGGADGLPFMEDLDDVIDGVLQRLGYNVRTAQAREEFFRRLVGDEFGRFLQKGISGLPGMPLDVSGRLGLGNILPATGLLVKKEDHSKDLLEVAGPSGDLVQRGFQSINYALDGRFGKAVTTILPTAARNVVKGADMASTGEYTDTRDKKVIDTTPGEAVAKMVGFQPTSVARRSDADRTAQVLIANAKMRESEIADLWARGVANGRPDDVKEAQAALRDWNEKNPDTPIRIAPRQIRQRVANLKKTRAERLQASSPKEMRARVREELGRG